MAFPCYTEAEAKVIIAKLWKEHHQATHICYAYRIGLTEVHTRANDDGEPNNSAGVPILGQIQSFDLQNVLVAVIRYYGGTKLGVGGLVQAYKSSAKETLENAEIIEKAVREKLLLKFSYNEMPAVMSLVKQYKIESMESDFNLDCRLTADVPLQILAQFTADLEDLKNIELTSLGIF